MNTVDVAYNVLVIVMYYRVTNSHGLHIIIYVWFDRGVEHRRRRRRRGE